MSIVLPIFRKDKLTAQEQLEFLEYLAMSLKNGLSLAESLQVMPALWSKKQMLLKKITYLMKQGVNFSQILQQMGFGKTIASQVDLAMMQGNLNECLSQLVIINRLKEQQVKKLKVELSYPITLFVLMIFMLLFMQNFLSSQLGQEDGTANLVFASLIIMALGISGAIARIAILLKKQDYNALKKLQHYPIIGKITRLYVFYMLSSEFGMMLGAGFTFPEICKLFARQEEGSLQEYLGRKMLAQFEAGKSMTEIIRNEVFLPDNLLLFVETGANKKELGLKCTILAKGFFRDLTQGLERMIVNVQPICFIFIGICIIGMYLKMLLPMYALMQNM
ncbi:type II secretion system F family protein [Lactobacillus jensenii]|uniref:type II secretion system F family protein n=1 Tax=Lactobacillus jensenii TaxID=109790 RepID=UPI001F089FF8|nr:type II secretion system F family protein [Lactobacillus jensenii]